jgi:hypothetical protein
MARTDKGLTCPPFCTKVMDKVRYFGRSWHSKTTQFLHAQGLLQDRLTIKNQNSCQIGIYQGARARKKARFGGFFHVLFSLKFFCGT